MCSRAIPHWGWRVAGLVEIQLGSVNTLKHLLIPSLQVTVGSNRISLISAQAVTFLVFLNGVSDRLSCISCTNGFVFWGDVFQSLICFCGTSVRVFAPFQPVSYALHAGAHLGQGVCGIESVWSQLSGQFD